MCNINVKVVMKYYWNNIIISNVCVLILLLMWKY